MAYPSKRLRKAREGREERPLSLKEALNQVVTRASARFDETVEIALALGIEARQSDQIVRGVASLPHGTGKVVRVLVFARGEKAEQALAAGADRVGAEDIKEDLMTGKIDFDRVIATPDTMALVGQVGKILGPRGLMPNPKLGTVTPNVAEAIRKVKTGDVPFRSEQGGLVHAGIGKVSFGESKLFDNVRAFADAVIKVRPPAAKGSYLKRIDISSTMGPSFRVETTSVS